MRFGEALGGERSETGRLEGWTIAWRGISILLAVLFQREKGVRTASLGRAPVVDQVLVFVEPPHAELARRLEPEPGLHLADQARVVGKDALGDGGLSSGVRMPTRRRTSR